MRQYLDTGSTQFLSLYNSKSDQIDMRDLEQDCSQNALFDVHKSD